MAAQRTEHPRVLPVVGVRLGSAAAGVRYRDRDDLVLMAFAAGSSIAAVFTRNAFCAAPVTLARRHWQTTAPRFALINAGNANAGTGAQGLDDALETCALVAQQVGAPPESVLPFSTGVIGQRLNLDAFRSGVPAAWADLTPTGWSRAARAIMTTDTRPKGASRQVRIDGQTVTLTGIAKGSGMIHPDMATMLAFVATDAAIAPADLQAALERATRVSFNAVSVDGDTSTNDACLLAATGAGGVRLAPGSEAWNQWENALTELCIELAQAMIRDGEGATKFITLDIRGGRDEAECRQVGFTIAHSPLVKTAFFASDANWGRLLACVGRAGLRDLDLSGVDLYLGDVCVIRGGEPDPAYREAQGAGVMREAEITVRIQLGRGEAAATLWTCDLSHDYVRINAEYRS